VQISGKVRARVMLPVDIDENAAWEACKDLDALKKHLEGKAIVKKIFVPKKLLNIVVKG
jgi:leucyl-tRNA synthetase